ncbi:hypothetical protein L873DRAFT_1704130 [Choiromyces venosus 120613-1]|uniref:Fungal-type protein kinase domain-containing protein n=1 Tax=Choiromyces venosus 120613-1 TaxID=1336337 RepID=A0A3N4J5T6_9PEZI|nr:hypothetical protein L873DRAFT_1704130 [Choiromyces venosus 120613-1]
MEQISATEERFVLMIEGKRSSLVDGMKQCLLSLKDMRDNNGGGDVYGFVTTGATWRMFRDDGRALQMSPRMNVVFDRIEVDQGGWMEDYSALVDCMFSALSNGGTFPNRSFAEAVVVAV